MPAGGWVVRRCRGAGGLVTASQRFFQACEGQRVGSGSATRGRMANEIADVLMNLVRFADVCGRDPLPTAWAKVERNEARYPVGGRGVTHANAPTCPMSATRNSTGVIMWCRSSSIPVLGTLLFNDAGRTPSPRRLAEFTMTVAPVRATASISRAGSEEEVHP